MYVLNGSPKGKTSLPKAGEGSHAGALSERVFYGEIKILALKNE